MASVKLAELYEALPPDAQRSLLEKHLLPLLNALPEELSNNVVSAAMEIRSRFRTMPRLDLKRKKKEVNGLMDALNLDTKLAATRDRSNREELLTEVVDSLTSWLNDIWSVAYEFHDNYHLAHVCLLFTADVASTLVEIPGIGCKCSLMNMPIDITIKARDGKMIKSFVLRGPHTLRKAILWIWREVFVSMLAYGSSSTKSKIPEMIEDVEMLMGWEALERLLYGGRSFVSKHEGFEDDDVWDDDDDDDDEEFPDDNVFDYVIEEDGDEDYVDEDSRHTPNGPSFIHATHWPESMAQHRTRLRELIEDRLHTIFRAMPSMDMFNVIRAISANPIVTDQILLKETNENATKSSDTLVGALAIYTSKVNAFRIYTLLDTHSHLLRPCDAEVLQKAVRVLAGSGYSSNALEILERELLDTIRAIHAALTAVFGLVDHTEHKIDVEEILKLRAGSSERKDRIQRWVDSILTHAAPMNPVAFAAMMMGFPMAAAVEEGGHEDPAGFLDDIDHADPDWEELKEEFRPPLKERFDGWCQLTAMWKETTNKTALGNVYAKAVQIMPYLRGADIVEHLIVRLTELHGKTHIARALQSLSNFCIFQRKKITTAANKQRRAAGRAPTSTTSTAPFGPSITPSFLFSFHSESNSQPSSLSAGMDDVD
ncbi:hypothetical protein H2248_005703 [Termitomyces sp. 'cryptogamus']|nr:hypothetical protein H2248_005703 [Termitomyces sp. 'cryptogamus']